MKKLKTEIMLTVEIKILWMRRERKKKIIYKKLLQKNKLNNN